MSVGCSTDSKLPAEHLQQHEVQGTVKCPWLCHLEDQGSQATQSRPRHAVAEDNDGTNHHLKAQVELSSSGLH